MKDTVTFIDGCVAGCASHFQPREERIEDTRPEPAAEEQPRNWVTRELELMREMFVKDTRPAPAAPVEKDERVEEAATYIKQVDEGIWTTTWLNTRDIQRIRSLLAVVGEMREKIKKYERLYTTRVTELEKLVEKLTVERDYAVNELDMFGYKLTELEQERDAALERVKELEALYRSLEETLAITLQEQRDAKDLINAAMDVMSGKEEKNV
jgi:hypothetical protein